MSRAIGFRNLRLAAVAGACLLAFSANARPSRIIVLRHAEKANASKLCDIGQRRAEALAAQYLGKDATMSLFSGGQAPAAFLSITLHSLETIAPAAQSWGQPVMTYSTLLSNDDGDSDELKEELLARRTQEAARDILTEPKFVGRTVVVSWEHKHIASKKLDQDATLRGLLGLADVKGVPITWPGGAYDYFWIVDYAPDSSTPANFKMIKQAFTKPFDDLPANDWGDDEPSKTHGGKDDCKE